MITAGILIIGLGLIIGSFLSVCIYRIPLGRFDHLDNSDITGEDPVPEDSYQAQSFDGSPVTFSFPRRSISPCCKQQLRWWHNIPLFSWLFLMGRCAFCKKPISLRYPLVELLTAACAFMSLMQFGLTPTGAVVFFFSCALIVITFIDYDYFIIPNLITYPGTAVGIALGLFCEWQPYYFFAPVTDGVMTSALGVLAGGGFLYLVSEVYFRIRKMDGLGMGDVKLLAMTGAVFGPECALFTIFMGSLVGSLLGVVLVLLGGKRYSQHIPFGPYLALGTILYLFFAPQLTELLNLPLAPRL